MGWSARELLELPTPYTADDAKRAFRRLARQWHPDVNPPPEATAKMQALNEAIDALGQLEPKQDSTFKKIDDVIRKGAVAEQQSAFGLLATLNSSEAERVIKRWADYLVQGKAAPEIALDIYEAAASTKALTKSVSAIDAALNKQKHTAWSYALTGGDAAEGKAIFTGCTTAACMLSTVAERLSPERLLKSVINPQAEIAEGYGLINATMKDGSIISGLLAKETPSELMLRVPATPITNTVAKADVQTRSKPASAMPVMTALLTRLEVRDLVAYLRTLK